MRTFSLFKNSAKAISAIPVISVHNNGPVKATKSIVLSGIAERNTFIYSPVYNALQNIKTPRMKQFFTRLIAIITVLAFSNFASFSQSTLISPTGDGGFETGATFALNNWTVVNNGTNTWQVGSAATAFAGTRSAFVSNNGGTTWAYTLTTSQTSHFYRDITVPAGETKIQLSFQWKGSGESGFDRLLVYTAPTSVTPVAGTPASSSTTLTGATLVFTQPSFAQASYTSAYVLLPSSLAGTTFRLIFTWQNDNTSGTSPGASVDNIQLTSATPNSSISSNAVAGNWSSPSTWAGGIVPDAGDNVTIVDGSTVTLDMSPTVGTLTVGGGTSGILQYDATARTLTANSNVTISSGASFKSAASGSTSTITSHALNVGGNLVNNGTLNFSATAGSGGTTVNASGALITFTGASNNTFDVSGATLTNLRNSTTSVTLNKGTTNTNVLTFTPSASYTSAAGATNSTTTITVGSTTGLSVGMYVSVTSGTGAFAVGTTVTSITNATQFVVSTAPSTALSASAVVTGSKFAVGSAAAISGASAGFLSISNGTFEVAGTNAISNPFFTSTSYSIPATGGFKLNNANATVTALGSSPSNLGLLSIAAGTYNIGTSSGNSMTGATGQYNISGGTLNIGARLTCSGAGSWTQSGGVVNVTTITGGNTSSSTGGLDFSSSTSSVNISGGTINLVTASTATTPLDYRFASSTVNITGGTLNVGTASTATNFNFRISGATPAIVVDNTTNNKTATLFAAVSAFGNVTINSGATMNLNGFTLSERSTTFTNNGTLTGTTSASRLSFFSSTNAAQTFAGTGTVTAPLDGLSVQTTGGLTITHTNQIPTLRVNLFAGTITNSNKITMGTGAALGVTTQVGASGNTTAGGAFDVSPTWNLGTGAYTLLYLEETAARTTGFAIPPTRIVNNLTIANANNVTLAGGNLSVGTLTLSGGKLITDAGNIVTIIGTTTTSTARSTYTSASLTSSSSGNTVTVGSTTNLSAGMTVTVTAGTGAFAANTIVTSVLSSTTFTVSATPTTPLSAATISGIGGWVSGPLAITLPASQATGSTFSIPVGKSDYSGFDLVNPTTNAGGTVVVQSEVFESNSGGTPGTNISALNTNKYWASSITSGAANFTNSLIKITDVTANAITSSTAIAASSSLAGSYDLVGGTSPTVVTGTSVTSATPAATSLTGFYALGTKAVGMAYTSSTSTQAVTTVVMRPSTNQQVIGIQVVTTGNANPLSLTSFSLNTTGTTNAAIDITNAKIWYTGTSSTFATTTQFGSTNASPSGSYNITGTQTLAEGTNYFWLTYDIPSGATVNNVIDAECTSITVGGNAQAPTVTAPAGTRTIKAQLNGTYAIGASQTSPNFVKLTDAIAELNLYGASGAVTFELQGDYSSTGETFPLTVNAYPGNNSINTLTIKPATGVTASISGVSTTGIIVINGADYITVNGSNGATANTVCPASAASRDLTITNTSTSTSSAVIWLQTATADGATNNNIINCNIVGNGNTQTLFGIGSGSSSISTSSLGTGNNNNSFVNNNISKTQYGIYSQGASTANKNTGTIINQNLINTASPNNVAIGGIRLGYDNGAIVSGNNISGMASTTDCFAIALGQTSYTNTTTTGNDVTNSSITKNVINSIVNNGTNSAIGIFVNAVTSGTTLVSNNMISGVASNGTSSDFCAGLVLGGGTGSVTNVYNNSIAMNGAITGSTAGTTQSFALAVTNTTAPTLDLRNNILVNSQTPNTSGTTKFYAIGLAYSSTAGNYTALTSNNNDLYVITGANYFTGITGSLSSGTTRTFAGWQTETGRDAASKNVAPVFISSSNLHLDNTNASNGINLDAQGTSIGSVTDDIDCNARDASTPDIGADEFVPPSCTGAVGGTASGDASFCGSGTPTITASGYSTGTGSTYQWMSSTNIGDYPAGGSAVSGQTNPATLTTGVVSTTTYYWLRVTCTSGTATDNSTMVTVTVNPATIASISGPSSKCTNDPAITLTENGGNGTSWSWSTGETTQSITVNPAATTTYTVTVTSAGPCTATATKTVTVSQNPTGVTAMASSTNICDGTSINLTSTANTPPSSILTENFETGATGWVFADSSSTGSAISGQIFHIQASPYTDPSGSITFSNFSMGGSNFAYANADAGGSGSNTRTFMTSPSFSTVGYTGSATLTFKNLYKYWSSSSPVEQVKVQISTDGGTTWDQLVNYSGADVGTTTSNAQVAVTSTVTIPSTYMGQSSVKLRWRYLSNWGYVWCVDDISLTGTPTPYNYAWTSSPAGFTSSIQNPTGVTPHTNTVYTVAVSSNGCSTAASTALVTVNPSVNAGTVSGTSPLCIGSTATYSSTGDAGGSWSSSNTYVATVNASTGLVTAVAAGTTNIVYTVSGCNGPATAFQALTVSPNANAGTVSGTSPLCIGSTATYSSNGDAGGSWSSTNPSVATVDASTGFVTAVSPGTTNITYTVSAGCNNPVSAFKTLTVNANVNAGTVSGTSPLCIGATATYSSTGDAGGSWSSDNTSVATVNATSGLVTAVAAGTANIIYTVTGCAGPATASHSLTVDPSANAGTVSGTSPLCIGATAQYSSDGDAGGSWSSSNTSVATVDASSGSVTAIGAGTTNIIYTVNTGCNSPVTAFQSLTVSPNANAGTVNGGSVLCIGNSASYFSNGDAGGSWSSSNTSVATVDASGVVTALAAGSTDITYTVSTGCNNPVSSFKTVTVNPNVNAGTVSGNSPLCIGATATYSSNGDAGGSWSSSNTAVATVDPSTGVVTALAAGTTNIIYTVSGCGGPATASQSLTVDPNANAGTVSGTSPLCIGATATYSSNGDAGGTWSSSNTSVATVDASSGLVTAVSAGTTNIIYTVNTGCNNPVSASQSLTVNPNANAGTISGTSPLCIGATATYSSNGDAGGSWSSSDESVATVNATTGFVTALSAGTTEIAYTVTGCNGPDRAVKTLTVNPNVNAGTVSGTSPLCIGATATYSSNGDAGGSWSSSNTAVATVNASTGVVTAVSAGTANIIYTVTGCNGPATASQSLTVDPNANAGTVSGTSFLCPGSSATFSSNGDAGGTWSSSNILVAVVDASTGVVTALTGGTTNITYTVNSGCNTPVSSFETLTVGTSVSPGTVSGTSPLCIGQTATYSSNGNAGGTWSSSNTSVATVNASTGVVTAVGAGNTDIIYTVTSCGGGTSSAFQSLTVDPNANAGTVSGTSPLCIGSTATYSSDGDAGGTWSSSNTSVATVNATSGLVTAVSAGTANIIYTVSTGCNTPVSAFQSLTVSPNANAGTVSGTSPLCIGATATYSSNGDAGGSWSSTNTSVATVDATSGLVTALSAGSTNITYTVSTGCNNPVSSFKTLTVDPNANAGTVSGTSPLCIGATATYTSNGDAGGSWSSSNTSVATVNATSGLVTAISAGTTNIVYTVSGCNGPAEASQSLTVSPNAFAGTVSGTSPLCIGGTATYSSNGDAGGTWSSSNTAVATVNATSGLVTAVSAGTTNIIYTVSTGCNNPVSASQSLTVSPNANAGTVSGTSPLCIGATATYTSNGDTGGSWSSSNTSVATVDATSGLVTALSAGTTNIVYTVSTGCNNPVSASKALTVSPNASAGTVSGTSPLCIGGTATYTSNGNAGGSWSSSNTSVATVNATSGLVTAVGAGTTNIIYTVSTGCNNPVNASQTLTVSPNASAGTVSGTSPLCIGATATYTSSGDAGGSWSSSNTAVATVDATSGLVTALSAGTTNIVYTVSTGCNNPVSASKALTVSPNANAGTVSGTSPLCINATATYTSNGNSGGTWSSSNTSVATVNATSGLVTAVGAGTTNIIYTVSTGCNTPVSASKALTVNPNANAGTVSGTSPLCIGATATYTSNGDAGGSWSSSNTNVATVNATSGLVTAIGQGVANITYTVSTGCNSPVTASKLLTVSPNASAGTIVGTSPLCIGQGSTYVSSGDAGGTWTSSNTTVATVNATTGRVSALSAGTTTITYTVSTGCNSPVSTSQILTVSPNASAGTVSGTSPLCINATATYTSNGNTGGTWSSSNTSVATVDASTGAVTAVGAGTTNITYTVNSGCNSPVSSSRSLTVSPNANPGTVTGTSPLCIGATATYSSNGDAGGSWSSSNTAVATVDATTGLVTAVAAGSANITYTVTTGCNAPASAFKTLTVSANANAGTVTGTSPLCTRANATYTSNGDAGGTWSSSNTAVATVNASTGVVTTVSAGTTIITYTVNTGCNSPVSSSQSLTVNPDVNAGAVSGTSPLCIGATALYTSNGDAGGTWSSSNTAVATVNATSGLVTAVSAGTATITYTVNTGCASPASASKTLTVSPNASAGTVSGTSPLCIGATATYTSNGNAGGSWSSSNTAVATVNATSGLVTAVGAGTTNIIYTVSSGCNTPVTASATLTVSPNANAGTVSGTSPLCIGSTATYSSNGDAGGTWSSSNTAVATVNATSGLVTAVSAGTTNITYTVNTGCNNPVSASQSLTVSPNATAGTVGGTTPLCIGASATYTSNGDAGGSWSSSNTSVATVDATSGVVTAVSAGSTTITYTVSTGCNNPSSASQSLTVNPNVDPGTVSGTSPLCIGAVTTYTSSGTSGGSWSSSNTAVATVNASSGAVTPLSAGTTIITYTLNTGCGAPVSASQSLTVNPSANAGTITGTSPLCINASVNYTSNGNAGGTWSSSNTSVATVNASSGVVTAVGAGSTIITYTVNTGCNSPISVSKSLTVNPDANAGTVTGTSPLCIGATATYTSNGNTGGTWSSSNTSVATVDASSGSVTAVGAGTADIIYTLNTGCNSPVSAFQSLTVNPTANAGTVSGTSPLCIGSTATYTSNGNSGGTWSSSNTSVATVDASSGLVTALSAGSTNITYTVSTGCYAPSTASATLTVSERVTINSVDVTQPTCSTPTGTIVVNATGTGTLEYSLNGEPFQLSNTFSGLTAGNYYIAARSQTNPSCVTDYTGNPVVINIAPETPSVNPVPSQVVTTGSNTNPINFSGSIPGTVYSWTNSDPSIGLAANGTGNIASFTAVNNGTTAVVATVTVTPSYTNAGGTCTGTPYSFTITVNPPGVYLHASVKKDADPTKINIEFTPTYNSTAGEYVNYMQFSVAIPAAGNAGVTATATGVNAFQNMGTFTVDGPYLEGSEMVYNFSFLNPAPPSTNHYSWTNGTAFTGAVVTFSNANAATVGKMVDFTNSESGYGGFNGNTFFGIITNTGDKTDFSSLFYSIPGLSETGNYPPLEGYDQFVQTITPVTPANDDAPGAITLTVDAGCSGSPFTNAGATQSSGEPFAACQGTAGYNTVWYKFVAPANGAVKITNDYSGGTMGEDSRLALYSTTDVNNYAAFTSLGCDDNNGVTDGGTRSVLYYTGLTGGATYYIQVDGKDASTTAGTFCLTVDAMTSSMIATSTSCAAGQDLTAVNNAYNGWLSATDASGKLVALIRNNAGTGTSTYNNSININTGAVRTDAASNQKYLDRNYTISNASVTNADLKLFFLNTELTALQAADAGVTIANLQANRQTGSVCDNNFVAANGTNSSIPQSADGSTSGFSWIQINTPGLSKFYLHTKKAYVPCKTWLQGAYASALGRHKNVTSTWDAVLNANALTQPYNVPGFGNYAGTESVPNGFFTQTTSSTTDVMDWVLLELRDATNPANTITRRAAFIREDGRIVDLDGVSDVSFRNVADGNYFVVIRHRNHLGIRTATARTLSSTLGTSVPAVYDFSTSQSQAYQNGAITANSAMVDLGGGVFGMMGGNANGSAGTPAVGNATIRANGGTNGLINDFIYLNTTVLGGNVNTPITNVYHTADLNMDGTVRANGGTNPAINDYLFLITTSLGGSVNKVLTQHL